MSDKTIKITLLPGDGIGPEIVDQAVKAVKAIGEKSSIKFEFNTQLIGAVSIDETGNPLPQDTIDSCKASDAVLLGAVGHPKYDNDPKAKIRPEQGLLAMRKKLGLFANVRPVNSIPSLIHKSPLKEHLVKDVDFVVIRELTGGIYFGEPRGRTEDGNTAFDSCVYTRGEVDRVARLAFDLARKRDSRLTAVDKANVLASSRLWRETIQGLESEYSDVKVDYMFVDNAAMQIIQNPKQFDVVVMENMFGDILTDEASVITGSLGLLPSASMGFHTSVFEPIHGSYPQAAGKNIANPLGTILSAAMMFRYALKLDNEADLIREACYSSIDAGVVTEDISKDNPAKTSEVGDWVANYILKK